MILRPVVVKWNLLVCDEDKKKQSLYTAWRRLGGEEV
jgi:hypothetical protein